MRKETPIENHIILTSRTDNHTKTIDLPTPNFTIIIKLNPNSIPSTLKSHNHPLTRSNKPLIHIHLFRTQCIPMTIIEKVSVCQINIKEHHQETNIKENLISTHTKIIHLLQTQFNPTLIYLTIPIQDTIKILSPIGLMKEISSSIKKIKHNKKVINQITTTRINFSIKIKINLNIRFHCYTPQILEE